MIWPMRLAGAESKKRDSSNWRLADAVSSPLVVEGSAA